MTRSVTLPPPAFVPLAVLWPDDRRHVTAAAWWRPVDGFVIDPDPWRSLTSLRPQPDPFRPEVAFPTLPEPDWRSLVPRHPWPQAEVERITPRGRSLVQAFRDLLVARDFPSAVLAFANTHGWLGHGLPVDPLGLQYAEPIALWRREVTAVADLLGVLEHALSLRHTHSELDRRWLLDRSIETDDAEVASTKLAFGRWADTHLTQPRGIFPISRLGASSNDRLANVALRAVALELELRLEGALGVSVVAAERRGGQLRFVPTTLLGFIYLELALRVSGPHESRMPLCASCNQPLRPGRTRRARYCDGSDACRARAYRRRRTR